MSYNTRSGIYTPTLTNVTNITASTAYQCQYFVAGQEVTVIGKVDIDLTANGAYELGISLPIPSEFTTEQQLAGIGSGVNSPTDSMYLKADITNNRASFVGDDNDATNHSHFFIFAYTIY